MNRKVTTSAAHSKNHPTGKSGIPFTRLPYRATELPPPPLHEVPAPVSRLPASEATPAAAFHLPSGVFIPWESVRPFLPDDAASCFLLFPFLPSGTTCKSSCTASPSGSMPYPSRRSVAGPPSPDWALLSSVLPPAGHRSGYSHLHSKVHK